MLDFQEFVDEIELVDCEPKNGLFTWNNHTLGFINIAERLDCFLVGLGWMKDNISYEPLILPDFVSNYFSIT